MGVSRNTKLSSTSATLSTLSKRPATQKRTYLSRQNRYSQFGWNANSQSCYTSEDMALLHKIQIEYGKLGKNNNDKPYFITKQETALWDYWTCDKPMLDGKSISYADKSFTLPNRITKDAKAFPLWDFADRMAKQIANWQAERAANSKPDVINDPAMLVFEELREWFFRVLSEKDGKPEDLQYITQRQSYINNLIHLLPDFGADRLHLHEIQHSLDEARDIVQATIANRELPQLLSGMIIDAKSLENTVGTYLHFLGINEPVDDNFSAGCLESSDTICKISPVRKVYDAAKTATVSAQENAQVARYQSQHSLYSLNTVNNNGIVKIHPELRTDAAKAIQFATFVTDADKKNYIEALAILEALTNVRKTLENFQSVQSSIGTYFFAYNYLDKTTQLASNYNALVMKATGLLGKLIQTADNGLRQILSENPHQRKNANIHFENNLRKLQTNVVTDSTLKNQLDSFSRKAMNSMNVYNGKMEELVSDLKSGKASDEVRRAMQELYTQVNDLNNMLAAVLNGEQITIDMNQSANCTDMPFANECTEKRLLPNECTEKRLLPKDETETVIETTTDKVTKNVTENTADTNQIISSERLEKIIATATHSAGYGAMRGATNVVGNAIQSRGYSQQVATIITQFMYYSMYFTSRFYMHYDPESFQKPTQAALDATQQAALETGQIWIASALLNQVGQGLEAAGNVLEKNNWIYTGYGLKKLAALTHYGIFAFAAAYDPVDVAVGLAAGTASEVVTERIGNAIFI